MQKKQIIGCGGMHFVSQPATIKNTYPRLYQLKGMRLHFISTIPYTLIFQTQRNTICGYKRLQR